ncbi:hypothetical protein RND81_01G140600 [Saponaria officinalis]|uniref:Uncharacterized protein n=1 Tax=Saponaria officinalis TaxID=3572 RepID=A0AAW1NF74_SAPOF
MPTNIRSSKLRSVGVSTDAFVLAVLEGSTQPGVWFREEPQGLVVEARKVLLERAAQGTFNFAMNKYVNNKRTTLFMSALMVIFHLLMTNFTLVPPMINKFYFIE